MEVVIGNGLDAEDVPLNYHTVSSISPQLMLHPMLAKMNLDDNSSLTMLPPFFFKNMSVLQVLDLSNTNIQSLPPSISRLCSLEEFILQECSLLLEVPPQIGLLKKLKMFDLEGTELMYLPKEIGNLHSLECLRVSLSTYADEHKDRNGIEHIFPRRTISRLTKLKELSISVDPEAEWWEVELLEAIMGDLIFLSELKILRLYLPTEALQQFLRIERYGVPIFISLSNYRFMVGQCEQLPLAIQLDIEEEFLKLKKCVKYMNGDGLTNETAELIRSARALYLRRHWTIEKLSIFDIRKLKYCLLMECNEMQIVVDQMDLYKHKNQSTSQGEDEILGSLEYLSIHFMKKLQGILKGPIGRNGLSFLKILALHTCPELTSIFEQCLLDNFRSLTELIVEDCPKVKSLVTLDEVSRWNEGPFLKNLKKILLLDLPGLVSISSGVPIAPQLDTLLVFNCMRLDYLSIMELPRGTKAIKGEIEWWDALKYGHLTWHSVFVQLKRDGSLIHNLAEDMNSLQHFRDLKMVPSHPGGSLRMDQNASVEHPSGLNYLCNESTEDREQVEKLKADHDASPLNETRKIPTQKNVDSDDDVQSQYAETPFRVWESSYPLNGNPHYEETEFDFEPLSHEDASVKKKSSNTDWKDHVKVEKGIDVEEPPDDGYIWSNYAERYTHDGKYPRTLSTTCSSTVTGSVSGALRTTESSTATESASANTDSHLELAIRPQKLISKKKKSSSTRNSKWTKHVKVILKTGSEEPPNDGYIWTNYDPHKKFKANNSREYYKCKSCNARKRVGRSSDDPSILAIAYKGVHTCPTLSRTSSSTTATKSALRILKSVDSSKTAGSASTITDTSFIPDSIEQMSGSVNMNRWKQQTN